MPAQKQVEFFYRLEKEAQLQSELHRTQVLPKWARGLARVVARYPWQVLLVASGLTACGLEWLR